MIEGESNHDKHNTPVDSDGKVEMSDEQFEKVRQRIHLSRLADAIRLTPRTEFPDEPIKKSELPEIMAEYLPESPEKRNN